MSLRLRLTLLTGLATFVVVALFGTGVYLVLSNRLYAGVDTSLEAYSGQIVRRLHRPMPPTPQALERVLIGGDPNEFAIAYDQNGDELARSPDATGSAIPLPDSARQRALAGLSTSKTVRVDDSYYRLDVIPVSPVRRAPGTYNPASDVRIISVSGSLDTVDTTLAALRLILLGGGAMALVSALGLGWVVAGRGLHPVSQLTRAAEDLGTDDLSKRLPEPGRKDEISRLSGAFNASLDRLETVYRALEESLNRQRQFVADASHELRTPLTVILNDAQTLIEHPEATQAQRDECLDELVLEAKRMARLSNDLLQLARTDADGRLEPVPVDWDALFSDAVQDAIRICSPRPVSADSRPPLGPGMGDRALLLRAFRAFFDNVARHTPDSATVAVTASGTDDAIELSVTDSGPGVPPEVLPRIFDRFFRADPSRHGHGTGLGLAIARHAVERHGGTVEAINVPGGGFRVAVSVPRWSLVEDESSSAVSPD